MAVFTYTAKDTSGCEFSGVYTDVESKAVLREELTKMGYVLVNARRENKSAKKTKHRVSQADVVAFAFQFSEMYNAGLSIIRCLETYEMQAGNTTLKAIVRDIREHLETGASMKEAFGRYREVFSEFFIGMLDAGESGGRLGETLRMSAEYLEKQAELKSKVRGAFAYPLVVGVMCILIVTALVIFVIPVFQKLYQQLRVPLPVPTLVLIFVSTAVRKFWWLFLLIIVPCAYGFRILKKQKWFKAKMDRLKLNIPVFGRLNRLIVVSRFIRTFALMASAGVQFVDALDFAKAVANNEEIGKIADKMQEEIAAGNSISGPMSRYEIFPPVIVQLAALGEEAGILPEMLTKGVEFLGIEIERSIKSLLIKIEPILSVILGAIVGGILLGVYLPMFDYMGHIK